MPAHFEVSVEKIEDNVLTLGVKIKHPEKEEFPTRKNFVLQLICDPIVQEDILDAPLLSYGGLDVIQDEDWLMDNEEELIESVEIVKVENFPIPDLSMLSHEDRLAFWKNSVMIPYARYEIIVSDSQILAHLHEDMKWDSAAYEF